jgi:hypothetical protein
MSRFLAGADKARRPAMLVRVTSVGEDRLTVEKE